MPMSLLETIEKTIRSFHMFDAGEKVVVAVSGGPDSMALLYALKDLNPKFCLKIAVAHLDHRMRRDSRNDCLFVKEHARRLGFSFTGGLIDKKRLDKKTSLEDAFRKYRYDFLIGVSNKYKAKKIALGHTKDDQAETVLMRVLRGSGLYGLAAILPNRLFRGRDIVRPLIEVSRSEVLAFLKRKKIAYRVDETNFLYKFFRNKVRNKLLPYLEKEYNAGVKEVLSKLALSVGADYSYLQNLALDFFEKNARFNDRSCSIDLVALKKLDISLRRLVLRICVEKLQGDLRRLEFRHWQEVEDLIFFRSKEAQVHLPKDLAVVKCAKQLKFLKR